MAKDARKGRHSMIIGCNNLSRESWTGSRSSGTKQESLRSSDEHSKKGFAGSLGSWSLRALRRNYKK
jgi:hypothetical protein